MPSLVMIVVTGLVWNFELTDSRAVPIPTGVATSFGAEPQERRRMPANPIEEIPLINRDKTAMLKLPFPELRLTPPPPKGAPTAVREAGW